MYWIDLNPQAPVFATPQEALTDWMRDHTTLPSKVFFKERGREGSIAIETEGPKIKEFIAGGIAYAIGATTWHDSR